MDGFDVTVIGAGCIGLAVAARCARQGKTVCVLERHRSFGEETSSRNSEVIHAGLYYPQGSLKAVLCVEGKALLYDYCAALRIPHRKTGKLIVAVTTEEIAQLEALRAQAAANGVTDLALWSFRQVRAKEPKVRCLAALFSPSTGILDTHAYLRCLADEAKGYGAQIAYETEALRTQPRAGGGYEVAARDPREGEFTFASRVVVNCAGLYADAMARAAGVDDPGDRIRFCKGDYFRVASAKARLVSTLVYPVPRPQAAGLGIHATLDLAGGVRLGPDDYYVDRIDYAVDPAKAEVFCAGAARFLPFLTPEDLAPDTAGIRPKLSGPGEGFRDFVIREESARGLPGLINCIGIESPGLTASLAIAGRVAGLARSAAA